MSKIISILKVILIVPALISTIRKNREKNQLKKKVLADGITDYQDAAQNIALGIGKGKKLYRTLITKVHPDRFPEEKKVLATELSARITQSKRNYKKLLELKQEADDFLNS